MSESEELMCLRTLPFLEMLPLIFCLEAHVQLEACTNMILKLREYTLTCTCYDRINNCKYYHIGSIRNCYTFIGVSSNTHYSFYLSSDHSFPLDSPSSVHTHAIVSIGVNECVNTALEWQGTHFMC